MAHGASVYAPQLRARFARRGNCLERFLRDKTPSQLFMANHCVKLMCSMEFTEALSVGPIFGCAEELEELLAWLPARAPVRFVGNYFDLGPDPLRVCQLLTAYKAQNPKVQYCANIHERFLQVAAGATPLGRHEKASWISPFHGTCRTIAALGLNPWTVLTLDDSPDQSRVAECLIRYGLHTLVTGPISEPYPAVTDSTCVFGGSLKVTDPSGKMVWQAKARRDYYNEDFLPWLYSELSKSVYGGKFPMRFSRLERA